MNVKTKVIAVTTEPALISKQPVSLGDNVSVTQDGLEKGVRGVSLYTPNSLLYAFEIFRSHVIMSPCLFAYTVQRQ